jgi:Glyoxalase-like domain
MGDALTGVRLRQAVLAAGDLEAVAGGLEANLGLRKPFHDPGVGMFGLTNAVFAIGDCFLEVVSPAQPNAAAARHLARHGDDCGYMVIFDLRDLEGARRRASELGIRVVWRVDLPDISATHLHPADTRGAIVSLDQSRPFGSWRWGGPEWTGRTGTGAPGHLAGITLAVSDPDAVAARWAHVLGVAVGGGEQPLIALDGGSITFTTAENERSEGLIEVALELPRELAAGRAAIKLGSARVRVCEAP